MIPLSAYSRDIFGNDKVRFIGTSKVGTDTFSQLASSKQAIKFDHVALGMHPFGFDGIEPGGEALATGRAESERRCRSA